MNKLSAVLILSALALCGQIGPGGGGGGGSNSVQGASALTTTGCVPFQSGTSGTVTCSSALTWNGTVLALPGAISAGVGSGTTGAIDLATGTTPSSPSSGFLSLFFNSANSNHLSSVNSSGSVADLQAGGAVSSLTTTGTSGASTLTGGVLNIPVYSGGGGSSFPLTIVQELAYGDSANATSFTITFPQATAASGNTAFMIVSSDGSQTVTMPSGWTVDFSQVQTTYARLTLLHKTTAGETTAAFSASGAFSLSAYFFEVSGSHALDQKSTGGAAQSSQTALPSITPTANSVVFGMIAYINPGSTGPPSFAAPTISPNWRNLGVTANTTSAGGRVLTGYVATIPATGSAIAPPPVSINTQSFISSGGIAYATFSIL